MKARLLLIILISFPLLNYAQHSESTDQFLFDYLYLDKFDSLNSCYQRFSENERTLLLTAIHNYLLDESNFICEKVIYHGPSSFTYGYGTEIAYNWDKWRDKKSLIYILLYDLLNGKVEDYSSRYFQKNDKLFSIVYRGISKEVAPYKKKNSFRCMQNVIESYTNYKVFKSIRKHYVQLFKKIEKKGLTENLANEAHKLPQNCQLIFKTNQ